MGEVPRMTRRAHSRGRDAQPDAQSAVEPDVRELFVAEYPALVRTLALIVRDRAAAEDLAQDAFVQLLRHWPRVATYDAPGAWLRRVAIRMAVREDYRSKVRPLREHEAYAGVPTADIQPDSHADPELMVAVAQLSPKQRSVVVLFYLEDRPMVEVADLVGCSVATGWVHLHRARRRLAELLGEEVTDDVD
jgi:RNA polymerase sigma-70 factor (ECF subfamily)